MLGPGVFAVLGSGVSSILGGRVVRLGRKDVGMAAFNQAASREDRETRRVTDPLQMSAFVNFGANKGDRRPVTREGG